MIKGPLTTDVPPNKIRFHHILHDLEILFDAVTDTKMKDFKQMHIFLSHHYNLSKEELLLQGMRRAYRQIVEGV